MFLKETDLKLDPKEILPMRLLLNLKDCGRRKCRGIVFGNRQVTDENETSNYAPVARLLTLRILLRLAFQSNYTIR